MSEKLMYVTEDSDPWEPLAIELGSDFAAELYRYDYEVGEDVDLVTSVAVNFHGTPEELYALAYQLMLRIVPGISARQMAALTQVGEIVEFQEPGE